MRYKISAIILIFLCFSSASAFAVDVAPRISDREIIESLAQLKSGQVSHDKRIDDLRLEMKRGQELLNKRIDDLRVEMKTGQKSLNKRIDDLRLDMKEGQRVLGERLTDLNHTMLTLFLGMMTLIVALFAYITWDRHTIMKPVLIRLDHLEQDFKRDLDIGNAAGSKLTRLIKAMRELSIKDEKVADVLRSFSLL